MVDTNMSSKVEVFLSCKQLPNFDTFSKSDPFAVVSLKEATSGTFREIGRTETIQDNQNPEWRKSFNMEYFFEEHQELKIDIYDSDGPSTLLSAHDYLGSVQLSLASLVAAPGQHMTEKLKKVGANVGRATLTLRCEEVSMTRDFINFSIAGEKLDKMDTFGKSDAYLQFFRVREDNTWVQVHQTEIVMSSLDPRWKDFSLTIAQLCNGDTRRPLKIKCWDWDKNSAHDFIGEFETSVKEILESKTPQFILKRPEHKDPKKRDKPHGKIIFTKAEYIKEYTFLDYISGGMQIGLVVAIDFTGSNGNPEDPTSLHYRRGAGPNEYQQAIATIGQIVAQYDTDQKFPVFGFGGKVSGAVSHCFPLTFNASQPEVAGVDGILRTYHESFKNVLLSGPTYFSEVIRTATSIASQPYTATLQHYSVLLIITDGVINDLNETISAVIDAAANPMSIIIVGVGAADFAQMEKLDGDDVKLELKGRKAPRDIVQFVPMRNFRGQHISRLAKETLAEVPAQVISFMKSKNVRPLPPRRPVLVPAATVMPAGVPPSPATVGMPMAGVPVAMGMPPPSGPVGVPMNGAPPPPPVYMSGPPPGAVLMPGPPPPGAMPIPVPMMQPPPHMMAAPMTVPPSNAPQEI